MIKINEEELLKNINEQVENDELKSEILKHISKNKEIDEINIKYKNILKEQEELKTKYNKMQEDYINVQNKYIERFSSNTKKIDDIISAKNTEYIDIKEI